MKHILQVLSFEYVGIIKSKSYIISTVIFLVLIILTAFLPGLIFSMQNGGDSSQQGEKSVITVCDKAYNDSELVTRSFEKYFPDAKIEITQDASVEKTVNSDKSEFAVVISEPLTCTYVTKNNSMFSDTATRLQNAVKEVYQASVMKNAGVSDAVSVDILNAQVKFATVTTGTDQTKNYLPTYLLIMILYIAIIMYGQMVSQSVVSEKNTRAMEMLITCAKPTHLMFGKVLGSGLAGLTQLLLIIATAFVSLNTVSKDSLPPEIMEFLNFPLRTVLFAVVFFILGYFIYSFLLGALASLASRSEDLNTLISPVMLLFMAAFMVVVFSINGDNINGSLMVVCSYIPFTAPIAMFARMALADVGVVEIIISVVVQILSIYLIGRLASAIYRIGVLMYGNPPKPAEIIKMLKDQHNTNKALKAAEKK